MFALKSLDEMGRTSQKAAMAFFGSLMVDNRSDVNFSFELKHMQMHAKVDTT